LGILQHQQGSNGHSSPQTFRKDPQDPAGKTLLSWVPDLMHEVQMAQLLSCWVMLLSLSAAVIAADV
jgi:hypothetical protein